MRYRLSDLRNFALVSSHRTISEAAQVIGMSQPALSESIKRLEKNLNLVLIFRTRSGISLSPEGRRLLGEAQKLIHSIDQFGDGEKTTEHSIEVPIRIGAHSVIAAWVIPQMIGKLQKTQPNFLFEVSHGLSREVQSQVQKGELDIGVVVNPLSAPGLVSKKIATDNVSVWYSTRDKEQNILFCNFNLMQTQQVLKKFDDAKKIKVVHSSSIEFIAEMVRSGAGMGVLPDRALTTKPAHVQKNEKIPAYKDIIHLMYRPDFGRTKYERAFLDAIYDRTT